MNFLSAHGSGHRLVTHYCLLEVAWQNAGAEIKGNQSSHKKAINPATPVITDSLIIGTRRNVLSLLLLLLL